MNIGLDEIIRSKRSKNFRGGKSRGGPGGGPGRGVGPGRAVAAGRGAAPGRVVDARLKIIQKTRSKITDARQILVQLARRQDARNNISRNNPNVGLRSKLGGIRRAPIPRRTISNKSPLHSGFIGESVVYRRVGERRRPENPGEGDWPPIQVHLGPTHHFNQLRSSSVAGGEEPWLRPPIFRRTEDIKSRLEPAREEEGYRIVVSNLQPTVTHEDIKELFEDVGVLVGSRVVRPGTAEVIYKRMEDAVGAVEIYHNRQLDGQPMKCMLVKAAHPIPTTKASIVPDLHAIHKALFNK